MVQIVAPDNSGASVSPSRRVREVLGAIRLASLCNRTTEAVRKWDRAKSKGGTGGLIPAEFQARILKVAREEALPLTADDLIADPIE